KKKKIENILAEPEDIDDNKTSDKNMKLDVKDINEDKEDCKMLVVNDKVFEKG
ncbi:14303_t:CDS:2, partial [Racocetra fulgida]